MKRDKDKHSYVYRVDHISTGTFYIGYRTIKKTVQPLEDLGIKYFTSSSWVRSSYKNQPSAYSRNILAVFNIPNDAHIFENRMIRMHIKDDRCLNRSINHRLANSCMSNEKPLISYRKIRRMKPRDAKVARQSVKDDIKRKQWETIKDSLPQYCDIETRQLIYVIE